MNAMEERRRFKRVVWNQPARVQKVEESPSGNILEVGGRVFHVTVENVSLGGACLAASSPVRNTEFLKIHLALPAQERAISGLGRIIWRREKKVGIQFVVMDENEKKELEQWIERLSS